MADDEHVVRIRKNAREEIRVGLQEYKGAQLASIRVWFQADDGSMRPGRDGLAFLVGVLPHIADAINATVDVARRRGLLDEL